MTLLDASFYLLSGVMAALSFALMWRHFPLGQNKRPGVMWVLYFFHMTAQFIPAVLFLTDPTKPAAVPCLAASALTAVLIPLGGMLANLMIENADRVHVGDVDRLMKSDDVSNRGVWRFTMVLSFCAAAIFCWYVYVVPVIPLLNLFADVSYKDMMADRNAASNAGLTFGWARVFLMPLLFLCLLLSWNTAKLVRQKIIIVLLMVMVMVYNGYTTEKAPVAMLFVMAFFAWFYLIDFGFNDGLRKMLRKLVVPAVLAALMIGYPVFVFSTTDVWKNGIGYILKVGVLDRIFLRPAINGYYAFEIFPDVYPYTFGQNILKVARLMGWPNWPLSEEVGYYKYLSVMNAPPPSVGTFYAMAGWPLVVLGVLWSSFLFRAGEVLLLTRPQRTALEVALYIMLLYAAFRFSWTSFHSILGTEMMMPGLLVYGLWFLYRKYSGMPVNAELKPAGR